VPMTVQSLVPKTVEVGHLRAFSAFSAFQSHFKLDFRKWIQNLIIKSCQVATELVVFLYRDPVKDS
jgi:hypothetical protein